MDMGLRAYNDKEFYLVESTDGAKDAYGFIHTNPPALKRRFLYR